MLGSDSTQFPGRSRLRQLSSHLSEIVLVVLSLPLAFLLGTRAPTMGPKLLAFVAVPIAAFFVFAQPFMGVLVIATTLPLEDLADVGSGITLTRLLGIGVFGVWLLHKLARRESLRSIVESRVFWLTFCLLLWILASALWAWEPSVVPGGAFSILNQFLWSLLVLDLATRWRRLDWLARVLVVSASVTAILTLGQYFSTPHTIESLARAGKGIAGGINATAYIMVVILPFAVYLIQTQQERFWRLAGLLYIPLAVAAVGVTFSRSSFVLSALALLPGFWLVARERGARGWLLALAGLMAVALSLMPLDQIGDRAETIVPFVTSVSAEQTFEGYEMADRVWLYMVGLSVFRHYPLLGVGFGNFGRAFVEHQFEVQSGYYINNPGLSPHSAYLGVLVELGLPGLLLWIALLGVVLRNLVVAWSTLVQKERSGQLFLVQAVTYSLLLQIGYGWVRPNFGEKSLWLLFGLSVAVRRLAEQQSKSYESDDGGLAAIPSLPDDP